MGINWDAIAPCRVEHLTVSVCSLPDGYTLGLPVIVISGRRSRPRILVVAGVHGDEYEGMCAIYRLAGTLDPSQLEGTVALVPVANPPAFAAGTRTSPADGLNLARIFPGDATGTLSHRIAQVLVETLLRGADLLIDLHSGGSRYRFARLAGFYSLDGRPDERSHRVAAAMGFPYVWALPHNEGVLSYTAARLGITAVGAEVSGTGGCLEEDVALYHAALERVVRYVTARDAPEPALDAPVWHGDWVLSPGNGLFEPLVALEQDVQAGDAVATIRDVFGRVQHTSRAPYGGRVLALRHLRSIGVGEWAVMILTPRAQGSLPAASLS